MILEDRTTAAELNYRYIYSLFIGMVKRIKYITATFLFICTFFGIIAKAQIKNDFKEQFSELTATDKALPASMGTNYYMLCFKSAKHLQQFQHDHAVIFHRQLSNLIFVISFPKSLGVINFQQYINWIKKATDDWKLSPGLLLHKITHAISFPSTFFVSVYNTAIFVHNSKGKNISTGDIGAGNTFILKLLSINHLNDLLQDDNVYFIAAYTPHPIEELQINTLDLSENKINLLHSKMPFLNAEGITISIKENTADTTDIDFASRHIYNPLQSPSISVHASIMCTMAAGAGNSWYLGKGVANAANITASDFSNLLPDAATNYQQFHISVQNHSYGVGIENFYGADAAAFDAAAANNDSILFVFSAGNAGNLLATTGSYVGIPGVANLTGSFKMAKNIITVGAVDSFGVVAAASSRGPAFDGRLKPELVAYGEDGTSGAAALVSGTAAVLQQVYKENYDGALPSSALIKAILVNSADDVGPAGIDFTSGYGNLNALKATENLLHANFVGAMGTNGNIFGLNLNIPPNTKKAKFTLVWNDPPATANAFRAIVNDLDLELQLPSTAQSWKPWVLNSFANRDSLSAPPVRKKDSLNTIEQITVDEPPPGNYLVQVKCTNINTPTQQFYVAYQFDSINHFSWSLPAATDNIFPGVSNIIRWTSDTTVTDAKLFYSINSGSSWQLIDNSINSSKKYYYWSAPDTNAIGLLKMQIGLKEFISDTFIISKKVNFKTGFNCTDSVLWYWDHLPGISHYQLFGLYGRQLQPIAIVADTQFVFNKNILLTHEFAVAPLINGTSGIKSYTTNYTKQGIGCYIINLTSDLINDNTASIQLTLGTTYLIKKIVFEKLQQGNFVSIRETSFISGLNYPFTDARLQKGINTYRVKIELYNGEIIYSFTTSVFYFNNSDVVVFPNPVQQGKAITIQMKNLQNQEISIVDVLGRKVFHQTAKNLSEQVPCYFSKGLYFVSIFDSESGYTKRFSVVVQ